MSGFFDDALESGEIAPPDNKEAAARRARNAHLQPCSPQAQPRIPGMERPAGWTIAGPGGLYFTTEREVADNARGMAHVEVAPLYSWPAPTDRVQELLEANNRYLERAREAEAKLEAALAEIAGAPARLEPLPVPPPPPSSTPSPSPSPSPPPPPTPSSTPAPPPTPSPSPPPSPSPSPSFSPSL